MSTQLGKAKGAESSIILIDNDIAHLLDYTKLSLRNLH